MVKFSALILYWRHSGYITP